MQWHLRKRLNDLKDLIETCFLPGVLVKNKDFPITFVFCKNIYFYFDKCNVIMSPLIGLIAKEMADEENTIK